jgi:hypothetical protein
MRRGKMKYFIALLTAGLIFGAAIQVQAEEVTNPTVEFDSYFRYRPSVDREQAPGKISLIESGAEVGYNFKIADKLPVSIAVGQEFVGINEENISVPLPARLTQIYVDLDTYLPTPFKKVYLGVRVSPSFNSDNWSGDSESFRISEKTFLVYQPSDTLTLIAGAAFYPGYEYNIWPFAGMIYKPTEKLSFNLVPRMPSIKYRMNERLAVLLTGAFENEEFQVARGNTGSAVLKYREKRIGGGVEYDVNKHIQAFMTVGGSFGRFLDYKDDIGKVQIESGVYTEVRLQAKF